MWSLKINESMNILFAGSSNESGYETSDNFPYVLQNLHTPHTQAATQNVRTAGRTVHSGTDCSTTYLKNMNGSGLLLSVAKSFTLLKPL